MQTLKPWHRQSKLKQTDQNKHNKDIETSKIEMSKSDLQPIRFRLDLFEFQIRKIHFGQDQIRKIF